MSSLSSSLSIFLSRSLSATVSLSFFSLSLPISVAEHGELSELSELPMCETAISCDNLPLDGFGRPPNPRVICSVLHATQDTTGILWHQHARTELLERTRTPQFLCTMRFLRSGGFKATTRLRFSVHDVRERVSSTSLPLGHAEVALGMVQESRRLRLPLTSPRGESGFITLTSWSPDAPAAAETALGRCAAAVAGAGAGAAPPPRSSTQLFEREREREPVEPFAKGKKRGKSSSLLEFPLTNAAIPAIPVQVIDALSRCHRSWACVSLCHNCAVWSASVPILACIRIACTRRWAPTLVCWKHCWSRVSAVPCRSSCSRFGYSARRSCCRRSPAWGS